MYSRKRIPAGIRTGIALPIIRLDGEDYDLSTLSRDELADLRIAVESGKAETDSQIEAAATTYNTTGKESDPQWFNAARNARRILGLQVQAIMAEQTKRKRKGSSVEFHFFEAAHEMLGRDAFEIILQEAERRQGAKGVAHADAS